MLENILNIPGDRPVFDALCPMWGKFIDQLPDHAVAQGNKGVALLATSFGRPGTRCVIMARKLRADIFSRLANTKNT